MTIKVISRINSTPAASPFTGAGSVARPRGGVRAACASLGLAGTLLVYATSAMALSPKEQMFKDATFNDAKGVKQALAHGLDPNSVDKYGTPLLVVAAREKADAVADLLINDQRTDIEALDTAQENALMLASINKDAGLVKALIDKDAEVNKQGWTPLHYAATSSADDIVKMLLDESAYVDAGSPNGTTPLMMAARAGSVSTVNLLLDGGADPTLKNQLGISAADFARQNHNTDLADMLDKRAQDVLAQRAAQKAAPAQQAPAAPRTGG